MGHVDVPRFTRSGGMNWNSLRVLPPSRGGDQGQHFASTMDSSLDACWTLPADTPISTPLAAACRSCFDSRSSLTARERTTAPTIVERMAMALLLGSSPSSSPSQRLSILRYSLIPVSNDAFTSLLCLAASEPSATTGQPSVLGSRCSVLR